MLLCVIPWVKQFDSNGICFLRLSFEQNIQIISFDRKLEGLITAFTIQG